jgi:hypothetical protein
VVAGRAGGGGEAGRLQAARQPDVVDAPVRPVRRPGALVGRPAAVNALGGFVLGHHAAYITNNSILSGAGQVVKVAI